MPYKKKLSYIDICDSYDKFMIEDNNEYRNFLIDTRGLDFRFGVDSHIKLMNNKRIKDKYRR
jgi:hypothetical protein